MTALTYNRIGANAMIIVNTYKLGDTDDFQVVNGKMRFDIQVEVLRENGGGEIPVSVIGGTEGFIVVSADAGVNPVLRLKATIH